MIENIINVSIHFLEIFIKVEIQKEKQHVICRVFSRNGKKPESKVMGKDFHPILKVILRHTRLFLPAFFFYSGGIQTHTTISTPRSERTCSKHGFFGKSRSDIAVYRFQDFLYLNGQYLMESSSPRTMILSPSEKKT